MKNKHATTLLRKRIMRDANRRLKYDPTCNNKREALRKAWSRYNRKTVSYLDSDESTDPLDFNFS